MSNASEERITELEIRLTHQDETIETLSSTLISQNNEMDVLKLRLEMLEKRLKSVTTSLLADQKDETPPPHY